MWSAVSLPTSNPYIILLNTSMVHCASMQNSVWPQQHNTRFVLILLHINNSKAIFIIRYALIMTTIVYKYAIDIKRPYALNTAVLWYNTLMEKCKHCQVFPDEVHVFTRGRLQKLQRVRESFVRGMLIAHEFYGNIHCGGVCYHQMV